MRSDMGRVVIERPRYGHSKCYGEVRNKKDTLKAQLKSLKTGDLHDEDFEDWFEEIALGGIESMTFPYVSGYNSKDFSDLLGPVHRYLQSKVGCKWDDVWSEVCDNLRGGYAIEHVREHVSDYVSRINESPYRTGPRTMEDIKYVYYGRNANFYVDEEGILRNQIVKPQEVTEYKTVDGCHFVRKEGEALWSLLGPSLYDSRRMTKLQKEESDKKKTYRYYIAPNGNEFVFVHNAWFTFEYRNLKDIAENSGHGVSSFWQGNIGPEDEGFAGVRFVKYEQYNVLGNKSSTHIQSNVSRNFIIRWKFHQASHSTLKKAGLI